jgi:hypothetical protein
MRENNCEKKKYKEKCERVKKLKKKIIKKTR